MAADGSPVIQENVNLQALNTLSVPATAQWFCRARFDRCLLACLELIRVKQCPLFILGDGSNVVLPEYFPGLVVAMRTRGRRLIQETKEAVLVEFAAGENWHKTVMWAVANGWSGIENLALIPGSVGAAPIQNIGAYGVELESCLDHLTGLDTTTGKMVTFSKADCEFAYRDSIFKQRLQDRIIITRVALRLTKVPRLTLHYPALREALRHLSSAELTPERIAAAVIQIRQSKLPDPTTLPNAGSFFKNPVIDAKHYQALKKSYPDMVAHALDENHFKVAAGWLLEQAGWKGRAVAGIAMYHRQALVLTNPEAKTSQQILAFACRIRDSIRQQFDITLEIEPRVLSG